MKTLGPVTNLYYGSQHPSPPQATAFQKGIEKLQQELVEANAQKSKALNDLHLAKEALSTTEARAHATHVCPNVSAHKAYNCTGGDW